MEKSKVIDVRVINDKSWRVAAITGIFSIIAVFIGIFATPYISNYLSPKPNLLILCTGGPFEAANGSMIDRHQVDIINQGNGNASNLDVELITYGRIIDYRFVSEPVPFQIINTTIPLNYSLELTNKASLWSGSHIQVFIDTIGNPGIRLLTIHSPSSSFAVINTSNLDDVPFYSGSNLTGKCG